MSEDLRLGGMSERTHAGYLRAVRKLADYCQASPDKVSEDQLRRFFLHMKNELNYAYGTLRVAFSGIKCFYTRTCKRDWRTLQQMKLQNVKSLPEVITRKQVLQIVAAADTQRMAVYFWIVYSLGLRMQEGLNLQVGDVDARRGMVHVHRGKGAKDRYIPLPSSTLQLLRFFWVTHKHKRLLFPADGRKHTGMSTAQTPMSPTAVQEGFYSYAEAFLRHPPPRSWRSTPADPGVSRPFQPAYHGDLHPPHPRNPRRCPRSHQPPRAAHLTPHHSVRARTGRHLPAGRPGLPACLPKAPAAVPPPGHERHRPLPYTRPRRIRLCL